MEWRGEEERRERGPCAEGKLSDQSADEKVTQRERERRINNYTHDVPYS